MARSDDAPLARVTYLPGVTPVVPSGRADLPAGDDEPEYAAGEWAVPGDRGDAGGAPGAARHVSLTALGRRGMSRRELERHLRDREFAEDEITDELERLERDGYVDDVALAQNLVGTLQERKGLGRSAIAAELTRRLLAPAAIEYALELIDTSDELSRAREIAAKRARQLGGLERDVAVRRLSAYLARRGYGGSTVRAVVDQVIPRETRRGVAFR
jgi:regulatory protein